ESVAVTRDGKRVITGSDDGTTIMWNLASGQRLLTLQPHTDLPSLATDVVGLLSSPQAPAILFAVSALYPEATPIASIAVSADGRRIITGDVNGTIRVWDPDSRRALLTLNGHTGQIWSLAATPDGQRIVVGAEDGTARLWDAVVGRQLL